MSVFSQQEEKMYTDFFHKIDETDGDGSGRLSLDNCLKALHLCGCRGSREVVQAFVQPEPGRDWKITLEDFLRLLPKAMPKPKPNYNAAELRQLFKAHDLNRDGHVSFHELRAVMSTSVSEEEIRDFIKDWDEDGDWKLNYNEFVSMYTSSAPDDDAGDTDPQDA